MSNAPLVQALQKKLGPQTQLLETHISWVLIAAPYAYKIKKPVNFGFINYTELTQRQQYCALEKTLNQRLAASLYLDVVPITGTVAAPEFDGHGPAIEYAVKMWAFDQAHLFSNLIKTRALTESHIQAASQQCARFHQHAEISLDGNFGTPQAVIEPMRENFAALSKLPAGAAYTEELTTIADWVDAFYEKHYDLLARRKKTGFIRATHGDLHLGNMVLFKDTPTIFDCIEFNEQFRWTDTMADIGFLTMDLEEKGRPDLASQFANQYFDVTHDYEGAQLLAFYAAYRAMVRAKVAAIQLTQLASTAPQAQALTQTLSNCIALAKTYTVAHRPTLTLTHGVTGSGKTTYTQRLLKDTRTIRLSSDIIRKHLYQLDIYAPCPTEKINDVYSEEAHQQVYSKLHDVTAALLEAGWSVIVDATFIKASHRAPFIALAQRLNIETTILSFECEMAALMSRLAARENTTTASDGHAEIAQQQQAVCEPVNPDEGAKIARIVE